MTASAAKAATNKNPVNRVNTIRPAPSDGETKLFPVSIAENISM